MTHRHRFAPDDEVGCVAIDAHVCLEATTHGGDPDVTDTATGEMSGGPVAHLAGFIVGHDVDWLEGLRCRGAVTIDPHFDRRWEMTGSLEAGDLTIAPSILCRAERPDGGECGWHGYVRNGKWVPV